jgi:acetyl esterase/lipase
MDIYLPSDANAPHPVIVTIAGSAWFSNNVKQAAIGRCGPLLDKGFAVAAVNHCSSSEAKFPAQINDIKGAVRFLRANASKYKLDPNFIGIMGDSSGGHLAALMGTSGGVKEYTIGSKTLNIEGDVGDNLKESSRVDAVVDLFGPTVFYKMNSQRIAGGMEHDGANSPESSLIGAPIQQNHDLCDLASPLTYIDANDPPFLIIHGNRDALVPLGQSVLLRDALTEKKVKNEMFTVENAGHEDAKIWSKEYMDKMIEFFIQEKNEKSGKE